MSKEKYLTAIIICDMPQINGNQFLKYRNIENTEKHKAKFLKFAEKFPGFHHINYYGKASRKFIEQVKPDPAPEHKSK